MNQKEINKRLFELQDKKYGSFMAGLLPSLERERIIGIRTPELKSLAKEICQEEDTDMFLHDLPHYYFEEDQLHAFIVSLNRDFAECLSQVNAFLPYINNWATCDQFAPKVFKKEADKLLPYIYAWLQSEHTYTIRFGIGMLMEHFLDERFKTEYADLVADLRSEEYYVNMMIAWYFATALAKQYDAIIPYIEKHRLSEWTHNKAIQKSIESYRISDEHKAYLRSLKIPSQKGKTS